MNQQGGEKAAWAAWYAGVGWPVFPVHWMRGDRCSCGRGTCSSAGKHPFGRAVSRGCQDASTDADVVREWWEDFPDANIGLSTNDLLVIDVDVSHGGVKNFGDLVRANGGLVPTVSARTGSGGFHLLFKPSPHPQGNRTGIVPGVDVRASGGYIVAPPSANQRGVYEWRPGRSPGEIPLAQANDWLLDLLAKQVQEFVPVPGMRSSRIDLNSIPEIANGTRHSRLLSIIAGITNQDAGDCSQPIAELTRSVLAKAVAINEFRCKPPLKDGGELEKMVEWCVTRNYSEKGVTCSSAKSAG